MAIYIICGLLSALLVVLSGMRGEEYDPNYFDFDLLLLCCLVFCGGCISLAVVIIISLWKFLWTSKIVTKKLYQLANIEIKFLKDEEETNDHM